MPESSKRGLTPDASLRVLLVEDSPDDAELICQELARHGLSFTSTRVETEQALRRHLADETWDVILSDHQIPGFGGRQALEVVKELGIDAPFIAVSGTFGEETAVAYMRAGASDYVMKQSLARLGPAVEREVREHRARRQQRRVTERAEALARTVLENLPVAAVFVFDKDLRYVLAGGAALRGTGYHGEALLGKTVREVLPKESADDLEPLYRAALAGEEAERVSEHGGRVYRTRTAPLPSEQHLRLGVLISEDITERRKAAENLRASEARLRELASATFEGIAFTEDGVVRDANAQLAGMFGYDEQELIGLGIIELVAPGDRERVSTKIREASEEPYQFRCIRKDGTIIPVQARARHIVRNGVRQRVTAVRDLSEVEEVRSALVEVKNREQALLDAVPVTLYTRRADGSFATTWISHNARAVTGFEPSSFLAPDFWQSRIHPDDAAHVFSELEQQLAGGDDFTGEYRWRVAGGDYRWFLDRGRVVRDDAGNELEIIGTFQDISGMVELRRQLAGAQRMEAVGRLAGGVAHDFNNLLAVVLAFSSFVLEETRPDDPAHKDLQEVVAAAKRGAGLTRQLLAFSRQQTIEPQHVRLIDTLQGLEKMLARLLGEDIDCAITIEPDLWPVFVDEGAMEQVIVNLAVNSRDAMPRGGKLTIEASNVALDAAAARQHDAKIPPGDYVLLATSDTGCGMDEQTRESIFEPFFSTKGEKGTGLGLSTCYGIVKQAKGFIWVYSELEVGTTFRVYLPRSSEERRSSRTAPDPAQILTGSETILVVEDERPVRALAVRALSRLGYCLLEAANGGEALLICEQHQGTIHLLLTDVVMPRMSGSALVERVASLRPEMEVLYMTGYTNEAVVRHGILAPGVQVIQKPFSPDALARRVRDILNAATEASST